MVDPFEVIGAEDRALDEGMGEGLVHSGGLKPVCRCNLLCPVEALVVYSKVLNPVQLRAKLVVVK